MEAKDEALLGDPQGLIIDKGGFIVFAVEAGDTVGRCA